MKQRQLTTLEHRCICHALWNMRMRQWYAIKYIHEKINKPLSISWKEYKADYSKKVNIKDWYNIYKEFLLT